MGMSKADSLVPLNRWIERVKARAIWSLANDRGTIITTAYVVGGRIFLAVIMQTARGTVTGWEIYIPASEKNSIAETLDAAGLALGVDGSDGLVPAK